MVAFGDDGDDDAVARFHFLQVGDGFFVAQHRGGIGFVARGDHDHRKIFVDQRVGAVLHFAGRIAFGVDVGNFLQLQRAFERDGVVDAAAEIEKIGVAEKLPRELFDFRVALEDVFDLVRNARDFLHQILAMRRA